MLLIEVGYKFRFFGEDAKVFQCRQFYSDIDCLEELGIAHFMSHNFYTASIPVPRLHIHVKRYDQQTSLVMLDSLQLDTKSELSAKFSRLGFY